MCSTMQGLFMLRNPAHAVELNASSMDRLLSPEVRTLAQQGSVVLRDVPSGKQALYTVRLRMYVETDYNERKRLAEEQLAIAVNGQLLPSIPQCMIDLGNLEFDHGEWAEAEAWALKALANCGVTGTHVNKAQALLLLSNVAMVRQEYAEAQRWAQAALVSGTEAGVPRGILWAHSALGDLACLQEDYLTANRHYQDGLALCQALNNRWASVFELSGLGSTASGLGQDESARVFLRDALTIAQALKDDQATLRAFTGMAECLAHIGEKERAVQLHTLVYNHPASGHVARVRAAVLLERLERDLLPVVYAVAVEQGKLLDLSATVKTLLDELSQPVQGATASQAPLQILPDPLTEREHEVLQLIAAGLSNYEIAVRLFVGISTVKKHVTHIFDKLAVSSRTQAILRARELNLL